MPGYPSNQMLSFRGVFGFGNASRSPSKTVFRCRWMISMLCDAGRPYPRPIRPPNWSKLMLCQMLMFRARHAVLPTTAGMGEIVG